MRERHDTGGRSVSLLRRMARFDDLPADQKAVLQLVLRQGRTYDEIAGLLKISTAGGPRPRAHRARRDRADRPCRSRRRPPGRSRRLPARPADRPRRAPRRASCSRARQPARDWARGVATELRGAGVAGEDALPEIPTDPAEVDEAFDALHARRAARVDQAALVAARRHPASSPPCCSWSSSASSPLTGVFSGSDDKTQGRAPPRRPHDLDRRDDHRGRAADQPHAAQRRQEAARRRQRRLPGRPARAGRRRPGPPGLRPLRPVGPQRLEVEVPRLLPGRHRLGRQQGPPPGPRRRPQRPGELLGDAGHPRGEQHAQAALARSS